MRELVFWSVLFSQCLNIASYSLKWEKSLVYAENSNLRTWQYSNKFYPILFWMSGVFKTIFLLRIHVHLISRAIKCKGLSYVYIYENVTEITLLGCLISMHMPVKISEKLNLNTDCYKNAAINFPSKNRSRGLYIETI